MSLLKLKLKRSVCGKIFLLVSGIILLSGCSKYQYVFVDSHMYQNDKKEFISENDTVSIKYTFQGENFPITLTIYNKLHQPLYIDWERSVVIINNVQVNGSFYHEGQISFIAPLSYATVKSNSLKDKFIDHDLNDPHMSVLVSGGDGTGTKYSYDERTTPLFFRNVLALTSNEDYSSPTFFDYSFWVSDIIHTGQAPSTIAYKPPNQFHIAKTTGFGSVMGWVGAITLIIVLGAFSSGE